MSQVVTNDSFVSLGGVEYSDQLTEGVLNYKAEEIDDTKMGATTRSRTGGLKDWDATFTFVQDEATGETGANLFALVGTTVAMLCRPVKATAVGASNPNYTGTGLVTEYTPLSPKIGELSKATVKIVAAGALSRATS